jgi:23S rRNA (uridine2552-2'-O)-methyltransferase
MSGAGGKGGSGRGGLHVRVKTAKKRSVSSTRWLQRQLNDPYVRRAQAEGYRSRAAYKLIELDEKFGFIKKARAVVDLGITPGGWSQVVRKANPRARVAGIDLLACEPIEGVEILEMDFMDDAAPDALIEALGSAPDLVISDMAANTVGHQQTDHLRTIGLAETAADFRGSDAAARRRVRRQGLCGRRRSHAADDSQEAFHDGEARQAASEPQGIARTLCYRAGFQRPP